ncbi:protein turtle homolog A-like isoform X2 [Babylonia areolata]|uniref:protein turtle homolog A-like isoform X2 n=1 Tax=Babylonia areolata TaxID=304850 RepID=UPI003FCF0A6E
MTCEVCVAVWAWIFCIVAVFRCGVECTRMGSTSSKVASVGGQQVLDCSLPLSVAQIMLYWRRDNIKEPILVRYGEYPIQVNHPQYKGRVTVVDKFSLQITSIRAEDEGWYECDATLINSDNKVNGNGTWIYLTVHSPPRIESSSSALLNHRRGEDIRLFCQGSGSPEPSLLWRKDGALLTSSRRISVQGKEVLIENLQRQDGGLYSCTFSNPVGDISQLIKLVVEGPPYIMKRPRNMTAVEGQRVLFSCGAEAFPDNITYNWYKDGTNVRHLPVYNKRLTLTGDTLLLRGVVKEDMGWYTCRPTNGIGQDEASAYLNVTYFPRVLKERMQSKVRWAKGFREKLDCPVDSNPPMVETIWTKGQTILDSVGRFDILLNGTLLVTNVREDDGGSYTCTPVSLLGQGQPSPNVQVIVRDPPYFTVRPKPLYQRQVGSPLLLPCAASGTPLPSVVWRKNGEVIDFGDARISQDGGNLSISAASKEDHGKYECVASNTIATIVSPTEVRILNTTPHAPYNVTVVPGLFSAEVSWAPAYDGGQPQFYMLWFRQKEGQWGQLTIPRDQSTTFTVYSLLPSTDYQFMVLSRNDLGNGSFSNVVTARTLGYRPDLVTALPTDASGVTYFPQVLKSLGPKPTPAQNVTATAGEGKVIVVTWHPSISPPVPVFWYEVHYRLAGSSRWTRYTQQVPATSPTRLEMKDLEPGVYQVRVLAYGVLAFSMPSNTATVDISSEEQLIPDAMIGGIVGGVLFLLVAVLLTTMAIIHSRRKDSKARNGHTNYADVSYGKPEDMNSLQQAAPKRDRWQQNGGGDIVTSITNNDSIFFLPRSHAPDLHPISDLTSPRGQEPRFYDYNPMYQKDVRLARSPPPPAYSDSRPHPQPHHYHHPHSPLSPQGSQPVVFSDTQPLVTSPARPRSRSQPSLHSHRFPSDPHDPRSPMSRDAPFAYPHGPPPRPPTFTRDPRDLSPHHRLPPSQPPPPYRSSGGSGGEDYPPKPPRGTDRAQHEPHTGHAPLPTAPADHGPRGYDGPFHSFHSEDEDDVFPHSPASAPFPRHSSMKPGAAPVSRGGEEEGGGEEAPAFTLSDISSVLDPPPGPHSTTTLPPPRRSWQPSQESSRSVPPHAEDRVWPSPPGANDSSDSSGRPLGYTRDQLHDVVDRLRHAPRSRSTPGDRYLDVSSQGPRGSRRDLHHPAHRSGYPGSGYPGDSHPTERRAEDVSTSSGIGSRNTSHSTSGSLRPRFKPAATSLSSLLTPHESSLAEDSSSLPFLHPHPHPHPRRDTSADENYEFDHLPALESDLLDDLDRYSRLAGTGRGDVMGDLFPKPRRHSQYADAEERFERLREEFQHYRQQQHNSPHHGATVTQPPPYSMDSDML